MSAGAPLRASLLTPAGRGAIATVLVTGPGAVELIGKLLLPSGRQKLSVGQRIYYGRWRDDAGEEVVVTARTADTVEIHCHGGQAAPAAILDSLEQLGCAIVGWETVLAPCSIAAEAQVALSQCATERAALHLLDQYNGALVAAVKNVRSLIDAGEIASAAQGIEGLLRSAPVGLHLACPWRVVIAGRPNVGKSSLINALLGYKRAIVFDQPGTTRDVVSAQTAFDGWPIELSDTAGLRDSAHEIEAAGVALAKGRIADANLVVLVFDVSEGWTAENEQLMSQWPHAVVVHNKADLPHRVTGRPDGLLLSATRATGLDELQQRVVEQLMSCALSPGQPVVFTTRQADLLRQAADALHDQRPAAAMLALECIDVSLAVESR